MKHAGFWLLLLVAVLVPATAAVAASMMYPEAIVAKQGGSGEHGAGVMPAKAAKAATGSTASGTHAGSSQRHKAKADVGEDKSCCEAKPCASCVTCSGCLSVAAAGAPQAGRPGGAHLRGPAPALPPAEFLLAGRERPPRRA